MKIFGERWENYHQKIYERWQDTVHHDDLILIPGDISWAMKLEDAMMDLEFIDQLKGTKVLIRGNHDYWWPSMAKLEKLPFQSLKYIHNNALLIKEIAICGTRLWDSSEYNFQQYVNFRENPKKKPKQDVDHEKIFQDELRRLEMSISQMAKAAPYKIAMTHYPPIGKDLNPSKCSKLFEDNHIQHVCFGHLHNLNQSLIPWGSARGVTYHFCSADEIDFKPQKIL